MRQAMEHGRPRSDTSPVCIQLHLFHPLLRLEDICFDGKASQGIAVSRLKGCLTQNSQECKGKGSNLHCRFDTLGLGTGDLSRVT